MERIYFLKAGFIDERNSVFKFRKELINWDEIENKELEFNEIPCLLYGNTGTNKGFCIYTGDNFMFFNARTPEEAVEFENKIISFEPL